MIRVKRIYDPVEKEDGFRILVDRLWPRGLSKDKAKIDIWLKELAPSNELRKWFAHDPAKYDDFQGRYEKELQAKKELIDKLRKLEQEEKIVTLLYSAKDRIRNQAIVLTQILQKSETT